MSIQDIPTQESDDTASEDTTVESLPTQIEENQEGESENDAEDTDVEETEGKQVPFHEHPRWKERETSWEKKMKSQRDEFSKELNDLKASFQKPEATEVPMPDWWGGDEAQWEQYQNDQSKIVKQAEENAIERMKSERDKQESAITEAREHMESELNTLESEYGSFDKNKLLKIVEDKQLLDVDGNWNYRLAHEFLQLEEKVTKNEKKVDKTDRKKMADPSKANGKTDSPNTFKTADDFKNRRPW